MTQRSRVATRVPAAACGLCTAGLLSILIAAAPATISSPTTTRIPDVTTAPTTQERRAQMTTWFAELSHRDPTEREVARAGLMSCTRADLSELRKVVEDALPLSPSQSAAIHDIVTHVYLTGADYVKSTQGFLGVKLGASLAAVADEENEQIDRPQRGAIIVERYPGFCGYRAFQNGDVILSIKERPEIVIQSVPDFQLAIMTSRAGTVMHLQVIRQMRMIEVEIQLDARPNGDMDEEMNVRDKAAEEYWNRNFSSLVTGGVS